MGRTNGTIERVSTAPISEVERGKAKEREYLNGEIEVIAVTRAWHRAHGAPDTYAELEALSDAGDLDVTRMRKMRQAMIRESYEPKGQDLAYYRKGDQGQAFLFAQAWAGKA